MYYSVCDWSSFEKSLINLLTPAQMFADLKQISTFSIGGLLWDNIGSKRCYQATSH